MMLRSIPGLLRPNEMYFFDRNRTLYEKKAKYQFLIRLRLFHLSLIRDFKKSVEYFDY